MRYPQSIEEYLDSPEVAPIAAEILYLIYAETGKDRGFDAVWLFDVVLADPARYPHLCQLTQQQFLWRLTMCLRTFGGWTKQSKNSHYWWRVPRRPSSRPVAWFRTWCEPPPPARTRSHFSHPDKTIQQRICDFLLRRNHDEKEDL